MTITNGYVTLAGFKAFAKIQSDDSSDDEVISDMVSDASRTIDNIARRHFYSTTTTRYFTAESNRILFVDDISTATGLTIYTDDDGDGVYENTWAATDYNLEPANSVNGWPFTMIEPSVYGNYVFPAGVPRGVKITCAFGWASVPYPIKEACLLIATSNYKQRFGESMGDIAQVTAAGVVLTAGGLPKAAMQKIQPYVRLI